MEVIKLRLLKSFKFFKDKIKGKGKGTYDGRWNLLREILKDVENVLLKDGRSREVHKNPSISSNLRRPIKFHMSERYFILSEVRGRGILMKPAIS